MSALAITRRKVAAGAVAAIASVGAGVGVYALTAPTSPSAASPSSPVNLAVSAQTATSSQTHATHKHKHRTLLQRSDHATIEVKRKGVWVTYEVDRGKVVSTANSSSSSSSVTLALPDGHQVTEAISPTTKFTGITGPSSLRSGVRAIVFSSNGTALRIHQAPAAALPPTPSPAPAA